MSRKSKSVALAAITSSPFSFVQGLLGKEEDSLRRNLGGQLKSKPLPFPDNHS